MTNDKQKLGLVLGRFQPLHPGHLQLIELAFEENNIVVICIGSAQVSEPLSIDERHKRIEKQLQILGYSSEEYRIVDLIDPEPMEIWPEYVKEKCAITDKTENRFYRSEQLPERYKEDLKNLGFALRIVEKLPFYYKTTEGYYYKVSSATEIKKIHEKLGKTHEL